MSRGLHLSRRALLIGGGIGVSFALGGLASCTLIPPIPKRPVPNTADAVGWIRLEADGRYVLWCPRAEMGQNVSAALRRIAALELGVADDAVDVQLPATSDIGRVKATVGSDSVRELLLPVARACAVLREAVAAGTARPGMRLQADDRPAEQLRAWVALKSALPPASTPAPGHLALVTGQPLFTADVRLPGLMHATVLRSPWRRELGAALDGWDREAVAAVPGFIAQFVHAELDGPALVARHPHALATMRAAAAPRWRAPAATPDAQAMVDIDAALAADRFTKDDGEVHAPQGPWTVDLRLDVPMAAHAAIEPRCAIARFADAPQLEVWCATQDPFYIRDVLARDQGLAAERIVVHQQRIGGAFGGRTIANVEREAAHIARTVGAPVKLQWTREDEFIGAFHRPPSSHRVRVRLGADGRIADWWHALSTSHILFTSAAMPPWMQTISRVVGDAGSARGQHPPYVIARQRRSLQLTRLPIATGPWRGLGAGPNVLAIEAAMDAAARAANEDPVAFRLKHLADAPAGDHLQRPARLADVLRRVAARASTQPMAIAGAGERIGRGVACGVYKGWGVAAAIAEVRIDAERIRVARLWCSHDCGAMVDPRGVRAQVEGNLVWSLGLVLGDELAAPQATPEPTSFAAYPLPRITDMPVLDIDLVPSTEAPGGAGETAIVAGAGAIYNAVVAATGLQPTRLPLRAAALKTPA